MAVHRPAKNTAARAKRKARTVSKTTFASLLTLPDQGAGAGGDEYLRAAADEVARGAKELAGVWSVKIPQMMYITVEDKVATIHAYAPNARPAEFRLRHPLFGNREHWYGPPGEKFLAPALDARIEEALRKYAGKIDAYAKKHGWK